MQPLFYILPSYVNYGTVVCGISIIYQIGFSKLAHLMGD